MQKWLVKPHKKCLIVFLHSTHNTTWLIEALDVSLSALVSLLSRLDSSLSGVDDLLNCVFSMKLSIPSALYG